MKFNTEHQSTLADVMTWRRDVRHFKTDAVPQDLWNTVKASIDTAPSVGNSQPWRLIEVEAKAVRQEILAYFTQENERASQDYDDEARAHYLRLKLAGLRQAPIQVAVFTDLAPAAGRGLGRKTMPETLHYSTVLALHTLWLTARAHNLGLGWVSIIDPKAVGRILAVPESWALTGYVCIGFPQVDQDTPELEQRNWQARQPSQWLKR